MQRVDGRLVLLVAQLPRGQPHAERFERDPCRVKQFELVTDQADDPAAQAGVPGKQFANGHKARVRPVKGMSLIFRESSTKDYGRC